MTKKCPFCQKEVNIEAIKCRYCREVLNRESFEKQKVNELPSILEQENWQLDQTNQKNILSLIKMLAVGVKKADIVEILLKNGIVKEKAELIVNHLASNAENYKNTPEGKADIRQYKRARSKKEILYGAGAFILGVIITSISHSLAGLEGTYIVMSGAILFGGIFFIKGIFGYLFSLRK